MRTRFLILFLAFGRLILFAQPHPVASFSFNKNTAQDDVSGHKASLVGTTPTKDRFGNEENAIYIHASDFSYVNLGNYPALKPPIATISLWFRMEAPSMAGRGSFVLPILLTKNIPGDDFYESYALYYHLHAGKVVAVNALDSVSYPQVYSRDAVQPLQWYHAVIQYSDTSLALFLNGVQQGNLKKNFRTRFWPTDSVMLGHSANKKNLRFFLGSIDDVLFFDRILSEKEIQELYEASNPNRSIVILKIIIIVFFILAAVFVLFLIFRFVRKKELARAKNKQLILEYKLIALKAQINPHFISNCLSAIQHLIKRNKAETATIYIAKFGLLVRQILDFSTRSVITLEEELNLLKIYLDLEQLRFDNRFDYVLKMSEEISPPEIYVPPLILNPIVENAIWHGLLPNELTRRGNLEIEVTRNASTLIISIRDNGIGINQQEVTRKKQENKSYGHNITEQRLLNLNYLYKSNVAKMTYENLSGNNSDSQGTLVSIFLPIILIPTG